MRILQIADWTSNPGGVEVSVARLRAALEAAGDEVRLLTGSAGSRAEGSAEYVAFASDRTAAQLALQVVNPFAIARLRGALREFRPDVVHVHMVETNLSSALFAALRAVPTVASVHFYKPICPIGTKVLPTGALCTVPAGRVCLRTGCQTLAAWLRDRPRYRLLLDGLARARVVAPSRWMRGHLAVSGIESEVVYPAVAAAPVERAARGSEPLLVYCGRLSPEKGVDLLLRAFARVRGARLRIVGDGPERLALEGRVRELGLGADVVFVGRVPAERVAEQLADAWALVAPSLWAEPFGLVAAEAIALGVPVVASDTGGFAETVQPGRSGLLFPNGDEAALAACLRSVVDGAIGVEPGESARIRARHAPERHAEAMRTIYAAAAREPTFAA